MVLSPLQGPTMYVNVQYSQNEEMCMISRSANIA